ncbi:MAG TPA: hypothetical protein VIM53_00875 [Candidatus Saccharimonadales bacterium]
MSEVSSMIEFSTAPEASFGAISVEEAAALQGYEAMLAAAREEKVVLQTAKATDALDLVFNVYASKDVEAVTPTSNLFLAFAKPAISATVHTTYGQYAEFAAYQQVEELVSAKAAAERAELEARNTPVESSKKRRARAAKAGAGVLGALIGAPAFAK